MRTRILLLLPLIMLCWACEKTEPEEPHITLSASELILGDQAGSKAELIVSANADWTLTTSGEGYQVSSRNGASGNTQITITATQANTTARRIELGRITFTRSGSGISSTLAVAQRSPTPQTMLLYMPGRNLMRFYKANIESIKAAVSAQVPGDGHILVCYQPDSHSKAELSEIYYDPQTKSAAVRVLKQYNSFSANDPASVGGMFADVARLAPAEQYGLSIGCHGKAWVPANQGGITPLSMQAHDQQWTPMAGALETRSFGDPPYELDIKQLAEVLQTQSFKFDYLIFDACFMANIETLYDLRHAVKYVVASPCEIMAAGFPYNRAIPELFKDGGTSYDLAQVCHQFWYFYMYDWNTVPNNAQSGCISLTITSELDAMASVMRRVNTARKAYNNELQTYEGMNIHLFFDMGHFVESSCSDPALIDEFHTQFDKAFPKESRLNTPSFYSAYNSLQNPITHYSGITLSEPSTRYAQQNELTDWYRATHL